MVQGLAVGTHVPTVPESTASTTISALPEVTWKAPSMDVRP